MTAESLQAVFNLASNHMPVNLTINVQLDKLIPVKYSTDVQNYVNKTKAYFNPWLLFESWAHKYFLNNQVEGDSEDIIKHSDDAQEDRDTYKYFYKAVCWIHPKASPLVDTASIYIYEDILNFTLTKSVDSISNFSMSLSPAKALKTQSGKWERIDSKQDSITAELFYDRVVNVGDMICVKFFQSSRNESVWDFTLNDSGQDACDRIPGLAQQYHQLECQRTCNQV